MDCHSYYSNALIPQTLKAARNPETLFLLPTKSAPQECTAHFTTLFAGTFAWFYGSKHLQHFIWAVHLFLRGDSPNNQGDVNSHVLQVFVPPTQTAHFSGTSRPGPISSHPRSAGCRIQSRGRSQAGRNKFQRPTLPETPS